MFSAFLKSRLDLAYFQKKDECHSCNISKIRLTWLEKCLKSPVLEDPLTSNMLNQPTHGWSLPESTFIIFIDNFQWNSVRKSLPEGMQNFRIVC